MYHNYTNIFFNFISKTKKNQFYLPTVQGILFHSKIYLRINMIITVLFLYS